MIRVKVVGATSMGIHLANACRQLNWETALVDADEKALERVKKEIYHQRYGKWDDGIKMTPLAGAPKGGFDYICIAVAPDARVGMAMEALAEKPKAIVLDRPACPPTMEGAAELAAAAKAAGVRIFVACELVVSRATEMVQELIAKRDVGDITSLDVEFRQHWDDVLKPQPWIFKPEGTHLASWEKGGGAGGEHSQGLLLWQHLARTLNFGAVTEIQALITYKTPTEADCYDEQFLCLLQTEKGFVGRLHQDVVSKPHRFRARLQGTGGLIEWVSFHGAETDAVFVTRAGSPEKINAVQKRRPEDFMQLMRHVWSSLDGRRPSPLDLERALDTSLLIAAAHMSEGIKGRVRIDPAAGWTQEALTPCQ